ncbi:MAG TPA: host specificity factor TipJ family phage tail protein [Patescibacteria group bacterium]|nr:host specificity factor TipJ family phage tail protein [Patescibacteria group bacterium]
MNQLPDQIAATLAPLPFAAERVTGSFAAGATIADIAGAMTGGLRQAFLHAWLDGHYIPRENWAALRPKPGTVLTFRAVPMGGGGSKNPLRTILSLALTAAMPGLAAGALGAFGFAAGSIGARLVTGGLGILSRLALNAIAPPARPRFSAQKESPTLFIQGAQNRATPFGRVPRVLGRHRFVPPFGALPYTESAGSDQYLRLLFVWGYGPLKITDLKIGETPLSEFEGVEVETREGYPDDAPLTLYSNSVLQNDLSASVRQSDGYIVRTTEADADEIGVDITLPRGLVKFGSKGGRQPASVRIEIQYAPMGTQDWSAGAEEFSPFPARELALPAKPRAYSKAGGSLPVVRHDRVAIDAASGALKVLRGVEFRVGLDEGAPEPPPLPPGMLALARVERRSDDSDAIATNAISDQRDATQFGVNFETGADFAVTAASADNTLNIAAGGLQFPGVEITSKQTAALRETVTFKVPKGQYDVRVRRVTPDADESNRIFDETVWTALRTIRYAYPIRMTGLAMTALRIKATGQLNGVVDRFNGVVSSILPDWDGTEWVAQETANPASLFRHVLQGSANARPLPDSRLDLQRIEEWHAANAAAGREFNMVTDYDVSVRETLQNIAAAGRASPTLIDGKWGVVEDRVQTVPVQHFTPRNSRDFEGRKDFAELPHALRIRFINRERGWLQDERLVYDDGYDAGNAALYETLELPGVTSPARAWADGRYQIAAARLRPESYSFTCDLEHIVCTRGDLVRFTHDVPLFGLMSARVKQVLTGEAGVTGVVLDARVAMEAGKTYAVRFRAADGTSLVAILQTAPGESETVFFGAPLAIAPAAGDLAMFGEAGLESVELIVTAIVPQGDLAARITCVDAAPGIHAADTGAIPPHASQITLPAEMQAPPVPVLEEIQSGEEALVRNTDGSLQTRILLTLQPPGRTRLTPQVLIRAQDETRFRPAEMTAQQERISITDVAEGETYELQVRYIGAGGIVSPPLFISGHRVQGTSALPSDVFGLTVNVLGDTAHLNWEPVGDLDLGGYTLRFTPQTTATWSEAVDIVTRIPREATSATVPAAAGTYLLKAVDIGGRLSANAAIAATAVNGGRGQNAILTLAEHPGFSGVRTGIANGGGALQLAGRDSVDDWPDFDAVANIDVGEAGLAESGIYEFAGTVDLGAVYTSRLTAQLAVAGVDLNAGVDSWGNVDLVENIDTSVDPSLWSLQLQLRSTRDDPDGTPAWSDWTPFVVGDYTARGFEFRVLMAAGATNVTPSLSLLSVDIDMPDRVHSGRGIAADAGGVDVSFNPPFRDTPAITVTPRDLASGDYYTVTAQAAGGFTIRFFNASGAGVARSFDYLARGYGEQA